MELSAFELTKHTSAPNALARLQETPLISYARVIKVIDAQTVVAETVVQTSLSREAYTVTLLNLSSALLEVSDYPKIGDTVLLLFLQRYDTFMFVLESVNNPNAVGYNRFSGVGILMSTAKNAASTVISHYEDGDKAVAELTSGAEVYGAFSNLLTLGSCPKFSKP